MKMHMILTVEDGPAALQQVAAIQGFANTLRVPLRMQAEGDERKREVGWGDKKAVTADDSSLLGKAKDILSDGSKMPRKEFVRALAKAARKDAKVIGIIVKRWIKAGVLEEV